MVGDGLGIAVGNCVLCDIAVEDSVVYGCVVSSIVVSGSVIDGVMNVEIGGIVTSVSSSSVNQIYYTHAKTNCNNHICK